MRNERIFLNSDDRQSSRGPGQTAPDPLSPYRWDTAKTLNIACYHLFLLFHTDKQDGWLCLPLSAQHIGGFEGLEDGRC
jgi:hypothetical protein